MDSAAADINATTTTKEATLHQHGIIQSNTSNHQQHQPQSIITNRDEPSSSTTTSYSEQQQQQKQKQQQLQLLGGPNATNGKPAYALLIGKLDPTFHHQQQQDDNNNNNNNEIISIPITRLPITIGKEHNTKDPSFVPLKEVTSTTNNDKANIPKLSQSMCCIFYRDAHGGKLGLYKKGGGGRKKKEAVVVESDKQAAAAAQQQQALSSDSIDPLGGMIYKPYQPPIPILDEDGNEKDASQQQQQALPDDIIRLPNMNKNNKAVQAPSALPLSNGFYAIECTGRKIMVGGRTIKKGQCAMLSNGMPIKIGTYCFYFLLPNNNKSSSSSTTPPTTSIKVKVNILGSTTTSSSPSTTIKEEKNSDTTINSSKKKKKQRSDSMVNSGATDKESVVLMSPPPSKKAKNSPVQPSAPTISTSTATSATQKPKNATSKADEPSSSTPLESKSDIELLTLLAQKVQRPDWDYEGQKIGSALAVRVCLAASKSSVINTIAKERGGVTQRELLDWMNNSNNDKQPITGSTSSRSSIFKDYEQMMLRKIEKKSFMINFGKGIVRAGFVKNEVMDGRSFRYNLPGGGVVTSAAGGGNVVVANPTTTTTKEDEKAVGGGIVVGAGAVVANNNSLTKKDDGETPAVGVVSLAVMAVPTVAPQVEQGVAKNSVEVEPIRPVDEPATGGGTKESIATEEDNIG